MTNAVLVLYLVAVLSASLGVVVFLTNTARRQNQAFLVFSLALTAWSAMMPTVMFAKTAQAAELLVRIISYVTVFIPVSIHLLFAAIRSPQSPMATIAWKVRFTFLASQAAGLAALSGAFITSVRMPATPVSGVAEPVYGPAFVPVALYFIVSLVAILARYFVCMRRARGLQRMELSFVLAGLAMAIGFGLTTNVLVVVLFRTAYSQPFGPLGLMAMHIVTAYAIATRRFMEVRHILRVATAHGLMALYLGTTYGFAWATLRASLGRVTPHARDIAHLLATVVVALLVAPVRGRMQQVASMLFINHPITDVRLAANRATAIVQSAGPLEAQVERFAALVAEVLESEWVAVYLLGAQSYELAHPRENAETVRPHNGDAVPPLPASLPAEHRLLRAVFAARDPLIAEALERLPQSDIRSQWPSEMKALGAAAVVAVRGKGRNEAVMLLGPRRSERVYGELELEALQVIADQLALAVDNARLQSEVQDTRLYNDLLIESLVSGVIAANSDRIIITANREAQRILGMGPEELIQKPVSVLPGPLSEQFAGVFGTGIGVRNLDLSLQHGGEQTPLQLGSSVFLGHRGDVLGAFLVFSDVTVVRKLETQVRRSAHLASLGTLAAGMAHEIKNPLVTLKTFSQLLKENYSDPEFRTTFAELVGKEVNRIDTTVNQLLRFGRPAKPNLSPISTRKVVEQALQLAAVPLRRKQIKLTTAWGADPDTINGDSSLIEQVFVNLFLNAVDAMNEGGVLHVATETIRPGQGISGSWESVLRDRHLRVTVSDTGCGIPEGDMGRIFDPFFTTKENGTGLGLSVVHGIVQEHRGLIDVESRVGKGTSFHIVLPLVTPEPRTSAGILAGVQ